MPRPLGYKQRDTKKLEARRFAAVARLQRGESTTAIARSLGGEHTVGATMAPMLPLARRGRAAPPPEVRAPS
jgi:hypothetical protein